MRRGRGVRRVKPLLYTEGEERGLQGVEGGRVGQYCVTERRKCKLWCFRRGRPGFNSQKPSSRTLLNWVVGTGRTKTKQTYTQVVVDFISSLAEAAPHINQTLVRLSRGNFIHRIYPEMGSLLSAHESQTLWQNLLEETHML